MEDIERYIKIIHQRRIATQRELDSLREESDEHKKLMKTLQDIKKEREECMESIAKNLKTITAQKHTIHKHIHSSKDISGMPIPHSYTEDMRTMFTDAIEFLNNIGDTFKTLSNAKENNDPTKLIKDVITCTEAAESKLYQSKCYITQLETLKEATQKCQQHIFNSTDSIEDESLNLNVNDESPE